MVALPSIGVVRNRRGHGFVRNPRRYLARQVLERLEQEPRIQTLAQIDGQ